MTNYNPVTEEVLEELRKAVGAEHVKNDAETLERYKTDEEPDAHYHHLPEVVVAPGSTEEVAAIMKIANKYLVPVTPRSAGTSVSCGAIPVFGGIVLLMERMNKIIKLDADAMYMEVEAGALTSDIQAKANEAGLLYAGDPCSADSCMIGGNIATNAGGNKAVRYGTTRHQVYSIEVVTPTGEIAELGNRLKKCSTGYCLDQLVMGNEDELDMKMEQLDEICTACGATDVVEADERVWKVRRSCLEGSKALSKVSTSDDLVVPIDKIAVCLNHLMEVSKQFDFECMCLAHAGDGNLHFNCLKMDMTDEEWEKQLAEFHKICYAYVYSLGGRLSGEHGIGAKKIDALAAYCDPVEMSIMKTIKRAMDPNNILNPGKLIRA